MSTPLTLPQRGIHEIADACGIRIHCSEGVLWITLDGDPRDIVLEANQSFTASEHRRALLYALQPAAFALADGPCTAGSAVRFWPRRSSRTPAGVPV